MSSLTQERPKSHRALVQQHEMSTGNHNCVQEEDKLSGWGNLSANVLGFLIFFSCLFRATPVASGSSQGRCQIKATAAGLCHSHCNIGSELEQDLSQGVFIEAREPLLVFYVVR